MSPSTATTGSSTTSSGRTETTRFRCPCGRSVVTQRGSDAATSGRCSSCRNRQRRETPLRRT